MIQINHVTSCRLLFGIAVFTVGLFILHVEVAAQQPAAEPPDKATDSAEGEAESKDAPKPSESVPSPSDRKQMGQSPRIPSQEELTRFFEEETPVDTPIRAGGELTAPPINQSASLVREGEYMTDRVGYLTNEAPWWVLRFESDSAEAPMPPVRILPNQLLERMVRETEATNERISYIVSGEATMFESQNYLLLRKVLRRRTPVNLER